MSEENKHENIKCSECGSYNLKIIVEKESEIYDLLSGILGAICFML